MVIYFFLRNQRIFKKHVQKRPRKIYLTVLGGKKLF